MCLADYGFVFRSCFDMLNQSKIQTQKRLKGTLNLMWQYETFYLPSLVLWWVYFVEITVGYMKVLFPPNPPPPPSSCLFPASHSLQTHPFHTSFFPSSFFAVIYFIEVSSCSGMVACACALSNITFFYFLTICLSKMCSVGAVSFQESIWKTG